LPPVLLAIKAFIAPVIVACAMFMESLQFLPKPHTDPEP